MLKPCSLDNIALNPKLGHIANKLNSIDMPFHNWYRFVLSFPAHLVRNYINRLGLNPNDVILDPFCGAGTTLVEAKLHGLSSIGIEANPMAHFASIVKTDWSVNPQNLLIHATSIAKKAQEVINAERLLPLRTLPEDAFSLLLKDSISPIPLHKALILLEQIKKAGEQDFFNHELLALAKTLVFSISNLYFGPEVGVKKIKRIDADVVEVWLSEIKSMCTDLYSARNQRAPTVIHYADSRHLTHLLKPESIDAVITSPPYPNEKDYTRTTRLESVILGFINNKIELRNLKKDLLRSNTRNVYKGDADDKWVSGHPEIQRIVNIIEKRRVQLNKTSGFERLYGRVTKLYFGGMTRHLESLRPFLKPGAHLCYVVGDQASYFQVLIKTGELLANIAKSLGYKVLDIELFRTRFATKTKQDMREEVVILQWQC